jgi:two-component system, OmpR family, response regulator CpxR
MQRVLVIDDDVELCELLAQYLKAEGFDLEAVTSGEQGVARALSGEPVLVVLDVMLPGMQGFEVLRQIRAQSYIPVLMLTARGDDFDRILGLELGADDYLPKPFNPRELAARIRAILRRAKPQSAELAPQLPEPILLADLELDHGARVVRRGGEPVNLTTVEFQLLEVLLRAAGRVMTREVLVREALGRDFSPFDRSIDVHVSNLRKKLGPHPDGTERIKGVRGFGYLYAAPDHSRRRGGSDAAPVS